MKAKSELELAFPYMIEVGDIVSWNKGMTLRDYFAGQALVGLFSNPRTGEKVTTWEEDAAFAYRAADAMLKARTDPA